MRDLRIARLCAAGRAHFSGLLVFGLLVAVLVVEESGAALGQEWGKKPHRSQPIPADLDLAKTA